MKNRTTEINNQINIIKSAAKVFNSLQSAIQWLKRHGYDFLATLAAAGQAVVCIVAAVAGFKIVQQALA